MSPARYILLAYAFSWWPWLIEARSILLLGLLVAALIVTAIIGRWTGLKSSVHVL
jgi:hypothetical protein